jgi:hypothetical protein
VRYGAVNVSANTVTTATAFHSSTSDDFDASVGVGINQAGGVFVFVNWAFTDSPAGVPTSAIVDMVPPNGGVPNLIGTGAVLVNGSITSETRFGDYTSVSIDPTSLAGSCAVVADQYFGTTGQWKTRIARIGTCLPQAVVPNLHGDTGRRRSALWPRAGCTSVSYPS